MEIDIQMVGVEADEDTTLSLQDWLQKERISELQVERQTSSPREGEMGIEPLSALAVILGSKAVIELVKSIHVWLKVRKPKLILKLKQGDMEVEIDADNPQNQQEIVEILLTGIQQAGS